MFILIFKVIFLFWRDFAVYLSVLFFPTLIMCMVPESQSRFFHFPENHIVNGLYFLPDKVFFN